MPFVSRDIVEKEADASAGQIHDFPLALAAPGERVSIVGTTAGKRLERRLSDLGFPIGAEVNIVHCHGQGCMVVGRECARVALGAGMAAKILVRPPKVKTPEQI